MLKLMTFTEVEKEAIKPNMMYQIKINGIRATLHIKNSKVVGIFGREGKPIMVLFPELRKLECFKNVSNAILDGEIAVFDKNGKSIFYGGIDHRNKTYTEDKEKKYPVRFVAFDLLQLNSQALVFKPYIERYNTLTKNFPMKSDTAFEIITNYSSFDQIWKIVVKKDLEGIVIKNPKSIYELGKRSKENLKYKNYKEATVTVQSREQNEKGVKITGVTKIDGVEVLVDCQLANYDVNDISDGDEVKILYLERIGNKLIQPHKLSSKKQEKILDEETNEENGSSGR